MMPGSVRREVRTRHPVEMVEPLEVFGPIDRAFDRFDRMFGTWPAFRLPLLTRRWLEEDFIPVDEFEEDGELVVKAEIPGIDPDRDVELSVSNGVLHITAERREDEHKEGTGFVRQEMHYGSFTRTLPLPEGVSETDIKASYKDGILEIRVPSPQVVAGTKIQITKG